jgi:hypothetical protein
MHRAALVLAASVFTESLAIAAEQGATRYREPAGTWLVMPYAEIPTLSLDVETPEARQRDGQSGDYEPNTTFQFGLRAVYDGWAMSVGSGVATVSDDDKGKTRLSDFGLAHYTRRFGLYGRIQSYRGMYSSLSDDAVEDEEAEFAKRPDIAMNNIEMNGIYIGDPDSFSLKAAFDLGEIQTAPGGSWLVMVSLQHLNVRSEDDLLVLDAPALGPEAPLGLRRAAATTLSVLPGYGYTFVLPESHYMTLAMMIGAGLQQRASELDGEHKDEWGTGMKTALQMSIGRNADDYLYGFSFHYLSTTASFQGVPVQMTSLPVMFFGGMRI